MTEFEQICSTKHGEILAPYRQKKKKKSKQNNRNQNNRNRHNRNKNQLHAHLMGFTFQSIQLYRLAHTSHYLDSHGRFHHRFLQLRFRPVPTGVGSSLCIGCFGKRRGRKTTMIWNPTSTLPLRLRSYRVKHFSPTPY